jgi:hypothetical protein
MGKYPISILNARLVSNIIDNISVEQIFNVKLSYGNPAIRDNLIVPEDAQILRSYHL